MAIGPGSGGFFIRDFRIRIFLHRQAEKASKRLHINAKKLAAFHVEKRKEATKM
jgi:hypothetical protein